MERPDGSPRAAKRCATPTVKIIKIRGTAQDITERKRAAEEIQDLYDHAPCGYDSIDENGIFVRINETELSWLGYTHAELVGKKKFQDLLTEESKKIFEQNFPKAETGRTPQGSGTRNGSQGRDDPAGPVKLHGGKGQIQRFIRDPNNSLRCYGKKTSG